MGPQYDPVVDSACNRNECQEDLLGYRRPVRRAGNLVISKCAVCIEILEASTSQSPSGVSRTLQ